MSINQIKEKLQALFVTYTKNLPNKIDNIDKLWMDLENNYTQKLFHDFHREIHSLCGSAGTYGYTELGKSARKLEVYLKPILNNTTLSSEQKNDIKKLLNQLKENLVQVVPKKITDTTDQLVARSTTNIVYLLDNDEDSMVEIAKNITSSGYDARKIPDIEKLITAIYENLPIAIIVDVQSVDEKNINILHGIQKKFSVPLFCTSTTGDLLTRLKAIRMGGQIFLHKPIDQIYLLKTLDQYCGFSQTEPYRILIIDDTYSLAEYFALILQEAGMITHFITNPLLLIDRIEEFQPDLLLMDVYMPECTGLELAAILRQEALYTRIPIIFLSTEEDRLKQLSALNLGGDDFLTKPILPQYLIEAVKLRAKRAGILSSFMMRDSLTGLINHTNILQRLDIELARAERQNEPLSFVMIDIDHFKNINDTYGHPIGDKVIRSLSNILQTLVRKTDIAGRYGGEEFALILPNTNKENSIKLCNYLREKFTNIFYQANNTEFNVTFSAGISSFPQLKGAKNLIDSADQALYIAKNNGRNQVRYFEEKSKENISI